MTLDEFIAVGKSLKPTHAVEWKYVMPFLEELKALRDAQAQIGEIYRERRLRREAQDAFSDLRRATQQLIDATAEPSSMVEAISCRDGIVAARTSAIAALVPPAPVPTRQEKETGR